MPSDPLSAVAVTLGHYQHPPKAARDWTAAICRPTLLASPCPISSRRVEDAESKFEADENEKRWNDMHWDCILIQRKNTSLESFTVIRKLLVVTWDSHIFEDPV